MNASGVWDVPHWLGNADAQNGNPPRFSPPVCGISGAPPHYAHAMAVHRLPDVNRIDGFDFHHPGGIDPSAGLLRLRYTDREGARYEVELPAMDALKLLGWLQQWSKDEVFDHLAALPSGHKH